MRSEESLCVPVTWHSKHELTSETNTKKKIKKTTTEPLTQKHGKHIKPESVGYCIKEFYQLFDKESGVAHNFTEGTGK